MQQVVVKYPQTLQRRIGDSKAVVDEVMCPSSRFGCGIEEVAVSPSGAWLVTQRYSGQGEWGYDVLRTCPLAWEAGTFDEPGYMLDLPRFSADETQLVGGFGKDWLGGWWAHPDDDSEQPARGGLMPFGYLFVHHLPSHRVERHELGMELPKGWLPHDPDNEMWLGATVIAPAAEGVQMTLPGGIDIEIAGPLPPVILLPTPHPAGGRLLSGPKEGVKLRQ